MDNFYLGLPYIDSCICMSQTRSKYTQHIMQCEVEPCYSTSLKCVHPILIDFLHSMSCTSINSYTL